MTVPTTNFVDRVSTALNIHFARVYGGMHFPRPLVTGGLTPWQLRLARDTINAHLEGELLLEQLAQETLGHPLCQRICPQHWDFSTSLADAEAYRCSEGSDANDRFLTS